MVELSGSGAVVIATVSRQLPACPAAGLSLSSLYFLHTTSVTPSCINWYPLLLMWMFSFSIKSIHKKNTFKGLLLVWGK
jgi:hypothetical protein